MTSLYSSVSVSMSVFAINRVILYSRLEFSRLACWKWNWHGRNDGLLTGLIQKVVASGIYHLVFKMSVKERKCCNQVKMHKSFWKKSQQCRKWSRLARSGESYRVCVCVWWTREGKMSFCEVQERGKVSLGDSTKLSKVDTPPLKWKGGSRDLWQTTKCIHKNR